jgi:predicted O-methyltransferase YrrM
MNIRNIAEIGFNAGHSCVCMLVLFPNSKITIFDIDKHKYTQKCFNLLDNAFPNRLRLIKGDSTKTIPMYDNKNIHDLVHIDGGHFNDIPLKDLYNSYNYLLSNKGYIIFDDTYYKNSVLLNIILSNCDNIFNMFIAEHKNTMNVVKVCNGSTISYVNK